MDERDIYLIAHALGLPRHPWRKNARACRWAYRNYFAAGRFGSDHESWESLVARGFARRERLISDLQYYSVTRSGVSEAGLDRYVPRDLLMP
jgi:hypothetical protein